MTPRQILEHDILTLGKRVSIAAAFGRAAVVINPDPAEAAVIVASPIRQRLAASIGRDFETRPHDSFLGEAS